MVRWLLLDEVSRCAWSAPNATPEMDIESATVLGTYNSESAAMEAAAKDLRMMSCQFTWADVRPIENCGICGKDFDATSFHRSFVLSKEKGREESPNVLEVKYLARFCQSCEPLSQ